MVTERRSEGCLYTLSSLFPASCGPIQTQRSTPSAKPESTDPGWLSSCLPIADQEAADGGEIRKSVESFHPRGAFPSLGLLPSPSLILLQGSPMSHLSSPPASLAPASRHHQCLPTAHCMTPAREALRVPVHVLGPSPLPRAFLSAGGSSLGPCVAASLFITLH